MAAAGIFKMYCCPATSKTEQSATTNMALKISLIVFPRSKTPSDLTRAADNGSAFRPVSGSQQSGEALVPGRFFRAPSRARPLQSNYFPALLLGTCSISLSGEDKVLFYPWYPAMMLAVESNNVIDIRLWKIATGGVDVMMETRLMVSEKVDAALEAGTMLMRGEGSAEIIKFYRGHVAANAERLAPRSS